MTAGRLIALLSIALMTVTGLGYLGSQTVLAPPPPPVSGKRQYVGASAPMPAPVAGRRRQQPTTRVDPAWVTATAAAADIPEPAVRAYAAAQLAEPTGCDVGWTTLAGIGWVESHHGTIGGRALHEDGRSSAPILGPALNGRGDVAAIPATPQSATWHGDPVWDHAVGPMQFIPSTWETWGADGDGDRDADPNDVDDAAFAAARYLCADGHDLTTASGWADAVFSYNHARSYVDAVHAAATRYADRTS
jgi:membrane-bound lytic murein transglycosylase B